MGTYHVSTGKFDLTVWFKYGAPTSPWPFEAVEIPAWKTAFERASELLYAATDGQHQLGKVTYALKDATVVGADAWLFRDTGTSGSTGARLWNSAHMELMNDEKNRPFVILHELGHYLYDLGDEYSGPPPNPWMDDIAASCLGRDASGHLPGACIMEGHWLDGLHFGSDGGGGTEVLGTATDFCVACNHDKGTAGSDCGDGLDETDHDNSASDTWQEDRHHKACWETIHDRHPEISKPGDRPDPEEPSCGPDPMEWEELQSELIFILLADTSDGFGYHPPAWFEDAKQSVLDWLDRSDSTERLGGVEFNRDVTSWGPEPVHYIPRPAVLKYLKDFEYGGRCAMGKALNKALEMIDRAGGNAATRDIILLSVAENNVDPDPLLILPRLVERGIRVHAVGLLPTADVDTLTALTAGTGGRLILLPPDLPPGRQPIRWAMHTLFAHTHAAADGVPLLPLTADGSDNEAYVEEDCEEAFFSLAWRGEEAALALELESPDGSRIAGDTEPGDRPFRLVRVRKPRAGPWRLRVKAARAAAGRPPEFELSALAVNRNLSVAIGARQALFPRDEPIRLEAQVASRRILTGLSVRGTITGPDGRKEEIELHDDGDRAHGSERSGSGHYVNLWTPRRGGAYRVELVADNRRGKADTDVRGCDGSKGPSKKERVAPFERIASSTILVGGPIGDNAAADPDRFRQGEDGPLRVRLDGIPFIPVVSRLNVGPGVQVVETPKHSTPKEVAFRISVDDRAPPGRRDGVVITQGGRYVIEDLLRIAGVKPEPPEVTPERLRYPGRFLLRHIRRQRRGNEDGCEEAR